MTTIGPESETDMDNEQKAFIQIKRIRGGADVSWSISVPADGRDHTAELDSARQQAIAQWRMLEELFPAKVHE